MQVSPMVQVSDSRWGRNWAQRSHWSLAPQCALLWITAMEGGQGSGLETVGWVGGGFRCIA